MSAISRLASDPLLTAARGVLYVLMFAVGIGALGSLAGMIALFVFGNPIASEFAREVPNMDFARFRWMIELLLALAIALLAALFRIFQLLKRVVDTVGEGDPFVPENASRLTQMAWLALAIQLISLPLTGLGVWAQKVTDGLGADGKIHIDGSLVGNGLLLMLILFVLARVFRKGAEMRAELEGTV